MKVPKNNIRVEIGSAADPIRERPVFYNLIENERRKERQRQGIKAAKKAGKYRGRRTVINKKLIDEVKYLKEIKNLLITTSLKNHN